MIVHRGKTAPLKNSDGKIQATAHYSNIFGGTDGTVIASVDLPGCTVMLHLTADAARALADELLACAAAIDVADKLAVAA